MLRLLFWFVILALTLRAEVNVREFGALGDGKSSDAGAIQRAIDKAGAAGDGVVRIAKGTYLSSSIRLRSRVTLRLEEGAVLVAAADGYDEPEFNASTAYQDFGHSHWHNSLIWGEDLKDVAIVGKGRIEGPGLERGEFSATAGGIMRAGSGNKAIALKNCRNVRIEGITISHGGHFAILATGCEGLVIKDVTIDTNRDGIDIDCCRKVRIEGCRVNSPDDDAICLKSSYALGRRQATEDVTISHCVVSGFDEGSLLDGSRKRPASEEPPNGRIKLGTESNAGFKRIRIEDCTFEYSKGLALEIVDGGVMEDVTVSRLTMKDIFTAPIFVCLSGRSRGPGPPPIGVIRRVTISDVTATNVSGRQGIFLTGLPGHLIEDLTLHDISITCAGGGSAEQATRTVPEREKGYPEPNKFGPTPAYGLYARHVRSLKLSNLKFELTSPDARPERQTEDVGLGK